MVFLILVTDPHLSPKKEIRHISEGDLSCSDDCAWVGAGGGEAIR